MSVSTPFDPAVTLPLARRNDAWATLAAAAGIGLLGARAWLVSPGATPVATAALLQVAVLALALAPAVPPATRARLGTPAALVVGIAAVLLTRRAAGTPVPLAVVPLAPFLNVLAAVAEEALFRRLLYARLERWGPLIAVGLSAIAFAAIHVPLYGAAALPVDLGAGVLLGWQRWASGTWTVPAATHAVANLLAMVP